MNRRDFLASCVAAVVPACASRTTAEKITVRGDELVLVVGAIARRILEGEAIVFAGVEHVLFTCDRSTNQHDLIVANMDLVREVRRADGGVERQILSKCLYHRDDGRSTVAEVAALLTQQSPLICKWHLHR